jgi:hypothetical protein
MDRLNGLPKCPPDFVALSEHTLSTHNHRQKSRYSSFVYSRNDDSSCSTSSTILTGCFSLVYTSCKRLEYMFYMLILFLIGTTNGVQEPTTLVIQEREYARRSKGSICFDPLVPCRRSHGVSEPYRRLCRTTPQSARPGRATSPCDVLPQNQVLSN